MSELDEALADVDTATSRLGHTMGMRLTDPLVSAELLNNLVSAVTALSWAVRILAKAQGESEEARDDELR